MRAKGDYNALLERIQAELGIENLSSKDISDWLGQHDPRGRSLGRIKLGSSLARLVNKERQLAISFSVGQEFARSRGITLTDKITAKTYNSWGSLHKKAIVIRGERGRIKGWKYI